MQPLCLFLIPQYIAGIRCFGFFCTGHLRSSVTESRLAMSNITRRQFLEDSILAAAAAATASIPTPVSAAEPGAASTNDKLTVAILRSGLRAKHSAGQNARKPDC